MGDNIAIVYRNLSDLIPYDKNPRNNEAAAEKVNAIFWELSDREKEIIQNLG